ncbi:hypothetical protein GJ496_007990 [Pomphorhynchus laevis]|nr:hypothetical protein GJ496_007990 [Pomphorhynchus laevis]
MLIQTVVYHDNAEINFIDDVGDSNDGFTNYRKQVYDHEKAIVEFISDIVESDNYLTDNERSNVHADEYRGKAEVCIIDDAGRLNDVFKEIDREYAHTVNGFNVKILHIHGDDT